MLFDGLVIFGHFGEIFSSGLAELGYASNGLFLNLGLIGWIISVKLR